MRRFPMHLIAQIKLSEKRREEILASCKKLGYTGPNKAAQSLRSGRFNIVALVLPDSVEYMITDPIASDFVKGVSAVLEKNKVNILLFSGASDSIDSVCDFVDGFICYGTPRNPKLIEELKNTAKKVVTADFDIDRRASVIVNNQQAAYEIAKLALHDNNDNVAVLGLRLIDSQVTCRVYEMPDAHSKASISIQRLQGYQQALVEQGISLAPDRLWNIPESNYHYASIAAKEALNSLPRPNVLLCMSDLIALAAIAEINSLGLRIPEDIRVVGFDGVEEATRSVPPLTTIHQNSIDKGMKAAELFIERATDAVLIPYRLEKRQSC